MKILLSTSNYKLLLKNSGFSFLFNKTKKGALSQEGYLFSLIIRTLAKKATSLNLFFFHHTSLKSPAFAGRQACCSPKADMASSSFFALSDKKISSSILRRLLISTSLSILSHANGFFWKRNKIPEILFCSNLDIDDPIHIY